MRIGIDFDNTLVSYDRAFATGGLNGPEDTWGS
jgi:predicted HAD superfamily phosphohydrolase YqeG